MKTKQVDLEIERLTMLKNRSELTENGIELLNELISLKEQLRIGSVIKSLPTDEEIYSEGCEYVRKIEQPNRQPLITLRRTFKAGAMFVKKQLVD